MARLAIKITPDQLKQASTLAGYGLTNEQIATILGISLRTINNKPELLQAIKDGKATAAATIMQTAFQIARKGNAAMCMFILKCKHGWREKDHESDRYNTADRKPVPLAYDPRNPTVKPPEPTKQQMKVIAEDARRIERAGAEVV